MKKTTFILVLSLGLLNMVYAGHNNCTAASEFNLRLEGNALLTMQLDQEYFNSPTSKISVANVTPGRHYLKVFRHQNGYYGCESYKTVVFQGYINIQGNREVYAMIDRFHHFRVLDEYALATYNNGCSCNACSNDVTYGGGYYNNQNNCNAGNDYYGNNTYNNQNGGYYTSTYTGNAYTNYGNGYTSGYNQPACMSQNAFNNLKYSITQTPFDNDRYRIAKQGIGTNKLKAQQIAILMGLLTYESNKLRLAKYAYNYCVDPQSYYLVNNEFTFSSSINTLDNYIYQY